MFRSRRSFFIFLCLFIVVWAAIALGPGALERSQNKVVQITHQPITEQARELHQSLIVGDWHADSLLWKRDLSHHKDRGHVDIPRLQIGNVALQMFTTVTKSPVGQNYSQNSVDAADNITRLALVQRWPRATWGSLSARALFQAQKLQTLAEQAADDFLFIRSQADLEYFLSERQSKPRLVGGLLGTEGSHALDGDLDNIIRLYNAGFRMMSLQHFFDNKLGGSLHGESGDGLSDFGRQAVQKMQELNIIVDVSHSSEQVVADVLAVSNKPLVISHTGFKGHCGSNRNINDSLMRGIAAQGGLIAVGYWGGAVCNPSPASIASAIKYGVELVGADHVSLGSDYDGSVTTSFDTSELILLTQALLNVGLSEPQIRKVMGGNMLRFLQKQLPPR